MNLKTQLAEFQKYSSGLTLPERATHSCGLAGQFEKAGEYEAAAEALAEFWTDRASPPNLKGLDESGQAEILLRVGALSGYLSSSDQSGSQETAKNLITRSLEIFEQLGLNRRVADAHGELALCYWREGAFDEARIHLNKALGLLKNNDGDLRACLLIRAGMIEVTAGRPIRALRYYEESAPLVEVSSDHALKGVLHNSVAALLTSLAAADNREEYLDRALIEYAGASFHFEQAGHARYRARVENNLGFLLFNVAKYRDAHLHLDRARDLFLQLGDVGSIAQVDDTRARLLIAEGRLQEAERYARAAVKVLDKGDEQALLAEALTTSGVVQARLGSHPSARASLRRAIEIAETAGDPEGAGRAKLSIIEELARQTSAVELAEIYEAAADLMRHSQDPSAGKRLIACSRKVIEALKAARPEDYLPHGDSWDGFSFRREIKKLEKTLLERALKDAAGSVTKASHLLGFKHHQSLISLIETRHRDLLKTRSVVRKRRHHLLSVQKKRQQQLIEPAWPGAGRTKARLRILQVEGHQVVADLVKDLVSAEDWHLDACDDGDTALERLTSEEPYDAIVVDNELPGMNGLELVRRTRRITHRRRTPIIMLSGDECETEAWRAGVNGFLRKPKEIGDLTATISRLVRNR